MSVEVGTLCRAKKRMIISPAVKYGLVDLVKEGEKKRKSIQRNRAGATWMDMSRWNGKNSRNLAGIMRSLSAMQEMFID
jgi:hypothetical protein